MRKLLPWATVLALVPLTAALHGAAPAKKPAVRTSKPAAKKPAAASTAKKSKGKKTVRKPSVTWRNRQTAPSPARYREIQAALVAKGHLRSGAVTGQWNQESADALRRFQLEQNLEATGKVNSLSLIALGLGPRYEAKAVPPPAAAPATAPQD